MADIHSTVINYIKCEWTKHLTQKAELIRLNNKSKIQWYASYRRRHAGRNDGWEFSRNDKQYKQDQSPVFKSPQQDLLLAVSQWKCQASARMAMKAAREKRQMTLKWTKIKPTVDFSTTTKGARSLCCEEMWA